MKNYHWVGAGLLTLMLSACVEPPGTAANLSQSTPTAVRLVIRFTMANAVWTASDLAGLRSRVLADVSPLAAVSDTTWAYSVLPQPGQDLDKVVRALQALPEVANVDVDSKARNP